MAYQFDCRQCGAKMTTVRDVHTCRACGTKWRIVWVRSDVAHLVRYADTAIVV